MYSLIYMYTIALAAALWLVLSSPIYCRSLCKADGCPPALYPPTQGRMNGDSALPAAMHRRLCTHLIWEVRRGERQGFYASCLSATIYFPSGAGESRSQTEVWQWVTIWSLFCCWELCNYIFPLFWSRLQGGRLALRPHTACQWQNQN